MDFSKRKFMKKEFVNSVNTCLEVQKTLSSCINASENFAKLNNNSKQIINRATSKDFISSYIAYFANPNMSFSLDKVMLFDSQSPFWNYKDNREVLTSLHEECNLLSMFECARTNFTIENLE